MGASLRMKLCFSSFTCPNWHLTQMIDAARGYDYDGLELRCDVNHAHGVEVGLSPERREAVREQLQQAGLQVPCISTSVQLAHEHADDILAGRVLLARDLGVGAVRVFCGHSEHELGLEDTLEAAGERLRKAARYALNLGVHIWIETHDMVAHGVNCLKLIRHADYENVGVVYDNLHPYRLGEKVDTTLSTIGSLIRMVHFHDGLNKADKVIVTPMHKGQLPVNDMFAALVNMGYDGWFSGQWFHQQYGHDEDESLHQYKQDMLKMYGRFVGGERRRY